MFEGGRLDGNFDAAIGRRDQAALGYRKAVLGALREVEDALALVEFSRQQQQALLSQQEALTDTLHHATNRYREGYSPYLEQIDAARALLGGQLTLIQAKSDQLASEVVLHQALSGGWIAAGDRAPGPGGSKATPVLPLIAIPVV